MTKSHKNEPATLAQINLLYNLLSELNKDVKARNGLTKVEATILIKKLLAEKRGLR